jgi:hypothetical protein
MTVRGLEPELQNLMARQRRELEAIRAEHEEALRAARAGAERRAEEERQRLVEQIERERQTEFAAIEQRAQRQIDRERESHKMEIERMMERLRTIESEKADVVIATRSENEAILGEMRERYKAELNAERLSMQQERQNLETQWKEAINRAKEETLASFQPREAELRTEIERAAKEKNEKKLRAVIQKLESDLNLQKKRIIDEADRKVSTAQLEARRAVSAMQNQRQSHQEEVAALKQEIVKEKALNNRLESENNRLSNEIEQQRQLKGKMQTEITEKESEMSRLRTDIQRREATAKESNLASVREVQQQLQEATAELQRQKAAFESEKKKLEEAHGAELSAVSAKVKTLIEGKEATIQALKEQLGVAQNRLREVEQLFHQQKKAILATKK